MTSFKNFIKNLLADEEGATAIEYALIVAMVAIAIAALIPTFRVAITAIFTNIQGTLTTNAT